MNMSLLHILFFNFLTWRLAWTNPQEVGKEVRRAIAKIGGTPPESIPPAEHIKKVKQRIKTSKPLLALDPKDAIGLIASDSK